MPLTDAKLRSLKPALKPYKVADSEGLHVLVTTGGSVLWRLPVSLTKDCADISRP